MKWRYKKLLSEKNFLKVQIRARQLMHDGSDLIAIYYKDRELIFKTRSGTDRRLVWTQRLVLDDVTIEAVSNAKNFQDVENLILNTGLKIHCDCLARGTRVKVKSGYKLIQDITSDDYVLSGDGSWQRVVALLKNNSSKDYVKINLKGEIDPLILSLDHKVLVSTYRTKCACGCGKKLRPVDPKVAKTYARLMFDRRTFIPKHSKRVIADSFKRIQLKQVKDLLPGDLLLSPMIPSTKSLGDVGYARMLGYYLAEGSMPLRGSTVSITLNQNERNTIAQDIYDYFSSKNIRVRIKNSEYEGKKWLDVFIYSKEFRNDCLKYCGKFSKTKRLDYAVFGWSVDEKVSFLIGYLLGDGCISGSFKWMSTSRDMIEDLRILLMSLGFEANVSVHNSARGNRSVVYGVGVAINDFYPHYINYLNLFRDKDVILPNKSRGKSSSVDNYIMRTIISVEPTVVNESYDISLLNDPHTYVANGVVVSNCPAFHYWGYKYMAWRRGYGLVKELRRPRVRNPYQRGYVCKHLYLVLQLYPFWSKTLASKFSSAAKRAKAVSNKSSGILDEPPDTNV